MRGPTSGGTNANAANRSAPQPQAGRGSVPARPGPLALWLMAALLVLLSAGSSRAQRPASVLAGSTDPVQPTSPQDWAQLILTTCQTEEKRWEESRAALERSEERRVGKECRL